MPTGRQCTLLGTTCHKRGPLVGSWTADTFAGTSVGMRKLVKTIKKPCSDVLMHTPVVFKGIPSDQRMSGCKG
jgi:hypothetical protein